MKIVHVTRQFYPAIGGIESVVLDLCKRQVSLGHQIDVVSLNKQWKKSGKLPSRESLGNIQITRIPYFGSSRYAIAPDVYKYVQGHDIIHLHSSDFFLDFLSISKIFHHIPIVLHSHGLFFHTQYALKLKRYYLRTFTKYALQRVNKVICVSKHDQEILNAIVKPEKLVIVPNGIADRFFRGINVEKREKLIISVCRLAENKRVSLLLETFAHLQSTIPEFRLIIIGKDQGELSYLERLSQSLGITEKVNFLGEVSYEILVDWLSKASIWVSASSYESFGVALVEAMASGCIPVVQRIPAFEEKITDGESGFLTDFSDRKISAEVILKAVELEISDRNRIINRAKEIAGYYNWEKISLEIEKIYKGILS